MIGQRGVPATSGGIERHVEEVGARLAALGHDVIVYCRPTYSVTRPAMHRGMLLRYVDTVDSKHFEAIVHSTATTIAALRERVDIVHYHALGPGLLAPVPRLFSRAGVVQTVHGLDQQRAKWGRTASAVLGLGCWTSARVPHATVVVSHALRDYYLSSFGRDTRYVSNGVSELPFQPPGKTLHALHLTAGSYILFVGRLVPEKAPDLLMRAFAQIDRPDLRLVIVGGSSFTDEFVADLQCRAAADPRVVLAGRLHGEPLRELYANAAAFVLPSDVEGMPLTLLEAAGEGAPLLTSDIAPHREMMGEDRPGRRQFRQGDLADLHKRLSAILDNLDEETEGAGAARAEVFKHYSWDRAAEELSELYAELTRGRLGIGGRTSFGSAAS